MPTAHCLSFRRPSTPGFALRVHAFENLHRCVKWVNWPRVSSKSSTTNYPSFSVLETYGPEIRLNYLPISIQFLAPHSLKSKSPVQCACKSTGKSNAQIKQFIRLALHLLCTQTPDRPSPYPPATYALYREGETRDSAAYDKDEPS